MTGPIRTCVGCRQAREKSVLVRLVASGDTVTVDATSRRPGRGAYVCRDRRCLSAALRRDGASIARALRLAHGARVEAPAVEAQYDEVVGGRAAGRPAGV